MQQPSLVKTVDQISTEERDIIKNRLQTTSVRKDATNPAFGIIHRATDGTEFTEQYYNKAFDYECRLWCIDMIKQKINQVRLPDFVYYLGMDDFIPAQKLDGVKFDGAFAIEIKEAAETAVQEIEYVHPMLRLAMINLFSVIKQWGPGMYVLIYTMVENDTIDQHDKIDIKIRPLGQITERLANCLNELKKATNAS